MIHLLNAIFMSATLITQPALSPTMPTESQIQSERYKKIVVILQTKTLELFEKDQLIKKYAVGIGKPKTPSPVGEGFIRSKGQMVFIHDKGPSKGKIILWSLLKNGKWVRIDYKKMLGFGIIIPGYDPFEYYIHSTTDPETVGEESSKGCIRMRISDMLELYPRVDVGTRIIIKK